MPRWWDEEDKGSLAATRLPPAKDPRRQRRWNSLVVLGIAALACLAGIGLLNRDVPAGTLTAPSVATASLSPAASVPSTASPAPPTPSPTTSLVSPPTTALVTLATLEIKGRAQVDDYDRALFGQRWLDVDRNGCDTRNDILRPDLVDIVLKPDTSGCAVLTGTLSDPYGGRTIAFERGQDTSSEVQIDHVVPLADAWQKGAREWTDDQRAAFANDPLNLLAVDGGLNQEKQAGDAATWLPPNRPYWCPYAARIVAVKARYSLWVTQAEHDSLEQILSTCPNEPLPVTGT